MKIFYIMACEECHHCVKMSAVRNVTGTIILGYNHYCLESEKPIPDMGKIAEFCKLEDAPK